MGADSVLTATGKGETLVIGNLIRRLNENARLLQDVLDAAHCIEPVKTEVAALRLFAQNPALSQNVLESLNDLVSSATELRGKILLAR